MFILEVPIQEVLAKAESIEEAKRAGLYRVAIAAQNIAERQVGNIRKRRVPTKREIALYNQARRITKTGRKRAIRADNSPAWEPTGQLAAAVAAEPIWESNNEIALVADLPYANARHDLATAAWIPKNPALGVMRKNEFFAETVEIIEPQVGELFADGFNSVWEAA